jgi:hypothetical protein
LERITCDEEPTYVGLMVERKPEEKAMIMNEFKELLADC